MFERCLCSELVFWFDIRCCIVYYIIYYIIHIIYYILYLYYILYIISYTIYYIIHYIILYSSSLLSFLFPISSSSSDLPLPTTHSFYTCRYLDMFIYILLSIYPLLPLPSSQPIFCSLLLFPIPNIWPRTFYRSGWLRCDVGNGWGFGNPVWAGVVCSSFRAGGMLGVIYYITIIYYTYTIIILLLYLILLYILYYTLPPLLFILFSSYSSFPIPFPLLFFFLFYSSSSPDLLLFCLYY
jgi:hypothetical protein